MLAGAVILGILCALADPVAMDSRRELARLERETAAMRASHDSSCPNPVKFHGIDLTNEGRGRKL
jgi:hypothetical protein